MPRARRIYALVLPLALTLALALPRAGSAGVDVWTSVGPELGQFTRLTTSPDGRIVFAYSQNGGLFRSADGGTTFSPLRQNVNLTFSEMTFDPRRPGRIWFGTAIGAYRSDDNGATFQAKSVGLVNPAVYRIDFDPHDGNRLWATTSTRVFVSSDGGETWSGNAAGPTLIKGLAADPAHAGRVWVISNNTATPLWRSVDGGATWATYGTGLPQAFPYGLAVDPSNPDRLWVSFTSAGIYRSEDAGATWSKVGGGLPPAEPTGALAITGTNPPRLFVHTSFDVWQSDDRGATFTATGIALREIQRIVVGGDTIWAMGLSGLYRRAVAGGSWEQIESGLSGLSVRSFAVGAGTGYRYLATHLGTFRDKGAGWEDISSSFSNERVVALAAAPGATEDALAGTRNFDSGSAFRTTGSGWTRSAQGLGPEGALYFAIDPARPQIRWAVVGPDLYRSTNGGSNWSRRSNGLPIDCCATGAVEPDPRGNGVVYALTFRGGLHKTTDDGASWSKPAPDLYFDLTSIAVDPQHPDRVYVGGGDGRVFRSENAGASWTTGGNLGAPVAGLLVDPRAGLDVVYAVGFGNGIWRSTDRGATWNPMSEGLGTNSISGLFSRLAGQVLTLYTASSTNGLFARTVSSGALAAAVDFTSSPNRPTEGEAVRFTASGVPAGAAVSWDFGDGTVGEGANPEHTFPGTGAYSVTLRVAVGAQGASKTRSVTIGEGSGGGDPCVASSTVLCVRQGRFRIAVDWKANGGQGPGTIVTQSGDSGLFWFFSPDNWELMVKVLDACGLNSRYWVFSAATTNVEYTLRVTDTTNGAEWSYHNPAGRPAPAITDTTAFSTCP